MKWLSRVINLVFVALVALLAGVAAARGFQIFSDHPLEATVTWGVMITATHMWVSIALLEGIRDAIRSLREDRR